MQPCVPTHRPALCMVTHHQHPSGDVSPSTSVPSSLPAASAAPSLSSSSSSSQSPSATSPPSVPSQTSSTNAGAPPPSAPPPPQPPLHVSYPPYAHALAGAGAGLAAVALLHPLDTIRTHMQSSRIEPTTTATAQPRPLLRTLRHLVALQGPRTLYRGLVPASLGSVMSWACYFHFFQHIRRVVTPHIQYPTAAHLFSGVVAGIVTSVGTNPIWVVKVRLQLQASPVNQPHHQHPFQYHHHHQPLARAPQMRPYHGFVDGLVTIAREEGMYGLYRGLAPSLWLVSHGALQFTLYESLKTSLQCGRSRRRAAATATETSSLSPVSSTAGTSATTHGTIGSGGAVSVADALVASTASKLVASVMTYPLQVARTRMQERLANGRQYGSFHRALWHIAQTEGVAGLYRGLSANIMRVTPQAAVTFVTYEQILRRYANG